MKVRCKFRVLKIQQHYVPNPDKRLTEVGLSPVWEQDGPNRQWSEATPQGSITLMITTPAADSFELGKEYLIDFMPVD